MKNQICQDCRHFRQHYVIDSQVCNPVNCGHCVFPRIKSKTPLTPACTYFAVREFPPDLPDRSGVIQFLTKDMLEYILNLSLPPEVLEDEGFD